MGKESTRYEETIHPNRISSTFDRQFTSKCYGQEEPFDKQEPDHEGFMRRVKTSYNFNHEKSKKKSLLSRVSRNLAKTIQIHSLLECRSREKDPSEPEEAIHYYLEFGEILSHEHGAAIHHHRYPT